MHKKSSLKDIGDKLDEFILSSKAMVAMEGHWDMAKHTLEQPNSPSKDKDQTDFDWFEHIAKSFDPNVPNWMEDEAQIDQLASEEHFMAKDIVDEVKFKDALRDHSIGSLTAEEHQEIALFHTMKQDPFYKHHLRTHLAKYADDLNETTLTINNPQSINPDDFTKFDRINLFDFRRTLPQKEREPKLDATGRAWGYGKRKNARVVASVRAGSGKITVNGKPFTQFFHMPHQRYMVLKPLTLTSYTCLLDVDLKVMGGGFTG